MTDAELAEWKAALAKKWTPGVLLVEPAIVEYARLAALAKAAVPALIAEVERLKAEAVKSREAFEVAHNGIEGLVGEVNRLTDELEQARARACTH